MYGVSINGALQKITGSSFSDANNIRHSSKILNRWSEQDLAAIGVYPIDTISEVDATTHDDLNEALTLIDGRIQRVVSGNRNEARFLARQKSEVSRIRDERITTQLGDIPSRLGKSTQGLLLVDQLGSGADAPEMNALRAQAAWWQATLAYEASLLSGLDSDPDLDITTGWPDYLS